MSKGIKNIQLEVNEIANNTWEVAIPNGKSLGMIVADGKKYKASTTNENYEVITNSLNDALSELIGYFNLHEKR